jgi:hypothetical protein
MLLIIVFCLFGAASLAFYLVNQTDKMQQIPDLAKVRRAIERFGEKFRIKPEWSEEDIEKQLAKYLQIHFRQVRRQFPVGEFSQRERIDIDIADGTFGIEIKLTTLLSKTNERNRLFGQIDTYQTRRYGRHRLLETNPAQQRRGTYFFDKTISIIRKKVGRATKKSYPKR